jgi:VWFA-related protein
MTIPARAAAGILVLVLSIAAGAAQQPAPEPPGGQPPPAARPAEEPARAQDPPPPTPQPERAGQPPIRTGINFVRVDVIVTDQKGEPVLDLQQGDFSISEDGKPQAIESFSVIKIDEVSQVESRPVTAIRNDYDEEREAARPDVRLFVILLDDYHVRRGSDLAVRKPLTEFIQNMLGPADLVAIMYPLTPVDDIRFTRNRDELIGAIERFEGRRFDYRPRNMFEEQYAYYPASVVERIRNQVSMGALKAAAMRMGALREGRKSILYVSEGLTTMLPAQINDPIAAMPGIGNPARRGAAVPDQVNEREHFFNSVDLTTEMRDVFEIANRQNTSIYPIDPRGLAAFEYDINQGVGLQVDKRDLNAGLDTLRILASNTDGRAIINRNDLATGMKQIIRDASGYYLLGYNSTQAPTDGKFHEIKVRVARKGVEVRARKGYWAYTAEDAVRATAPPKPEAPPAVTAALNSIVEPVRGRPARFWIGTGKGENGRTRVTFAWEPIAATAGERRDEGSSAARVALTATAPDGRPLYRGTVPEEAGASDAAVGRLVSFEAPPGPVQLRMVVEGGNGQVLDSTVREMTLPDFTAVQLAFETPRVYRGRTARDLSVIAAAPNPAPTVDREFSRTERLLVRASANTPGGVAPTFTARLLNRAGQKMADLPVQSKGGAAELTLVLAPLPAADYLLELNAATESGTAQELIAFKVGR